MTTRRTGLRSAIVLSLLAACLSPILTTRSFLYGADRPKPKDYALIIGTVWGPDDLPVYPTHRTAAYPTGVKTAVYPEPRTGLEAVSNHLLRYLGGGVRRDFDSFVVRANGDVLRVGFREQRIARGHDCDRHGELQGGRGSDAVVDSAAPRSDPREAAPPRGRLPCVRLDRSARATCRARPAARCRSGCSRTSFRCPNHPR